MTCSGLPARKQRNTAGLIGTGRLLFGDSCEVKTGIRAHLGFACWGRSCRLETAPRAPASEDWKEVAPYARVSLQELLEIRSLLVQRSSTMSSLSTPSPRSTACHGGTCAELHNSRPREGHVTRVLGANRPGSPLFRHEKLLPVKGNLCKESPLRSSRQLPADIEGAAPEAPNLLSFCSF